jgi:hypothetical protein
MSYISEILTELFASSFVSVYVCVMLDVYVESM